MPRNKTSKTIPKIPQATARPPRTNPIDPDKPAPLTPEERTWLRTWLADPVVKRALALVQLHRPGPFSPRNPADAPTFNEHAGQLVCRQQGWDLYETALFTLITAPAEKPEPLTETFPDEGLEPESNNT